MHAKSYERERGAARTLQPAPSWQRAATTNRFCHIGFLIIVLSFGLGLRGHAADAGRLEITRFGPNVRLTWTNSAAALEQALGLTGPWSRISGAASGFTTPVTNFSRFFRLREDVAPPPPNRYLPPEFNLSIGNPIGGGCACTSPENPNSGVSAGGSAQDNGLGSVLLHTGEVTQNAVDMVIPGRGFDWRFVRRYRSGMNYDGPLGHGWDFSYNRRLFVETNGNMLCIDGLGRADRYTPNTNGTFDAPSGFYTRLRRNPDGTFEERNRHGMTNSYSGTNSLGISRLTRISDRYGNQMTFQHNSTGQLTNVIDTLNRSIAYRYDIDGRLTNVTDFAGRSLRFGYDANDNLISATSPAVTNTPNGNDFPSGKTTLYTYAGGFGDPRFNHNLLSVTAANEVATNGPARLVAQYETNPVSSNADRVVSIRIGGTNATGIGAGGTISYTYASFAPVGSNDYVSPVFQSTVTNRGGNSTQYRFNQLGNIVRTIQFTRGLRTSEPAGYTNTFAYNRDGEMIARTNAELDSVAYTFDSGNPDPFQHGNLLQVRRLPGPRGGDQLQIVTIQTYETNFNLLATITDGRGNVTTHRYDAKGNRTNTVHRIPATVEDFQYNAFGQMTVYLLPDNGSGHRRRDFMTYYTVGPQTGYLQSYVVDTGPTNFNLTTTYEYDARGNVVRRIDPRGNDTLYTVNALNQVIRQRSAQALLGIRYEQLSWYDANNNLVRDDVQNRNELGTLQANSHLTTISEFDVLDNRVRLVQEKGNANLANAVVTSAAIPAGSRSQFLTTEYRYDANENLTLTRFGEATAGNDPYNIVQSIWDERDLRFRDIRAPGSGSPLVSTTQSDYDGNGNRIQTAKGTESVPRLHRYFYDGFDRLVRTLDPMGNTQTNRYDANDNRLSDRTDGQINDVAGSAGNVRLAETRYAYDANDRLTNRAYQFFDPRTQAPIGDGQAVIRFTYSANSQRLSYIDDNSNRTTYTYDTANRILTVTDAKTNTVTHLYDSNSNLREKIAVDLSDVTGQTNEIFSTRSVYDALDRLIVRTDNGGYVTRNAYDSRGNLTVSTNARGNLRLHRYDGLNRQTETVRLLTDTGDGSGVIVGAITNLQTWDDSSRLTTRTDGNGNTTAYLYDSLNRLIHTTYADGTTNVSFYNQHNNITFRIDAMGTTVETAFDLLNRPTTNNVTPGAGVQGTTFERYQYDGLSRIIRAENDDTIVSNRYDSLSQLLLQSQQVLPGGAPNIVTMTRDGEGNLTRIAYPGDRIIERTFDPLNRVKVSRDDPAGSESTNAIYQYIGRDRVTRHNYGNGTRMDVAYDVVARIRGIQHSAFDVPFYDGHFAWDQNHNCTASSNLLAGTKMLYEYDSLDRLVVSGDPTIYQLDAVGNRSHVNQGPGAGSYFMDNTLPEPGDFQMNQYTFGAGSSRQHNANGNLIQSGGRTFAYDFRDRLVQADGGSITYKYDCYGRRVEKNVSGNITRFVYRDWDEIEEQDSFGVTLTSFVWSNGELLQMNRGGQRYFYHGDHLGRTAHITDGFGNVVESYTYDDYGTPQPNFSSIGNPFLFTNQRYDPETGWYYYRNRHFDPAAGRFVTRDPIGLWGDKCNMGNGYTYVGNNPLTFTDPLGLGSTVTEEEEWPQDGDKGYKPTGREQNCKKIKGSDKEVCKSTGLQWRLYVDVSLEGSLTYKSSAEAKTPLSGILPFEVKAAVEGAIKGAVKGGSTFFFNFIRVECQQTWQEKCDVEYQESQWIEVIKDLYDQKGILVWKGSGYWQEIRKFWVSETVTRFGDTRRFWKMVKPPVDPPGNQPEHGPGAGGD